VLLGFAACLQEFVDAKQKDGVAIFYKSRKNILPKKHEY
jgi:hypothetical protein